MTSLTLAQIALLSGLDITNMEILLGPIVITSSLLNSLLMLNKVGRLFNVSRLNLKFLSLSAERGSLES